jgi:hypothetical protein
MSQGRMHPDEIAHMRMAPPAEPKPVPSTLVAENWYESEATVAAAGQKLGVERHPREDLEKYKKRIAECIRQRVRGAPKSEPASPDPEQPKEEVGLSSNVWPIGKRRGADVREPQEDQERGSDKLLRSDRGAIKPCEHNACELLADAAQYGGLHFDEFLSRMRLDARDWTDADDLAALSWLQSKHSVPGFTLGQVRNAARTLAYSRRRDSLREFVDGLPRWDGTPRIEMAFVDAWGARDDTLTRAASRNFFVALIARAMKPGAQVDTVWCFEGPQGTLKSSSLRALGISFHAEITATIGTADFMRELRGIWIAEMSELDSLRGREASTVKRLLSAPKDRFVQKYALHADSYERRAVAVATTNETTYWEDPTGARRLIPVSCGAIRLELIKANRLQWFSEARELYQTGATWWVFPATIEAAREERQAVDPWELTLRKRMVHGRRMDEHSLAVIPWPDGYISSADIMSDWLELAPHQQGHNVSKRLGHVMRRLGYKPKRTATERGWVRDDASVSENGEASCNVSQAPPSESDTSDTSDT